MSIPPDAISVIVRCKAIERCLSGGMSAFEDLSNATFRTDGQIAAVSFKSDMDAIFFSMRLKDLGLKPGRDMLSYKWTGYSPVCRWLVLDAEGNYSLKARSKTARL